MSQTYAPFQSPVLRARIKSVLTPLNLYADNSCELLLGTCAQESLFGTYRTQGGGGPARGIFQMEGNTHNDIWANYLKYHQALSASIISLCPTHQTDDMINNDVYAIVMCRVHYLRAPGALPSSTDLTGLWSYYKRYYNTPGGAATSSQFYSNYRKYVSDGVAR